MLGGDHHLSAGVGWRAAQAEAGVQAAHLVLPATARGKQLLNHQHRVHQVGPGVAAAAGTAPAGRNHSPGQDAAGAETASLRQLRPKLQPEARA